MTSDSLGPDELLEHFGFVRELSAALVRDSDVAEDVAQNAMLAAIQGTSTAIQGAKPWLRGVVRNLVRTHYRNEGRKQRRDVDYLRMDRTDSEGEEQMEVEKALERAEQRAVLVQAVMGLREPYRSVIVLRFFEEKTPKEVARVLDRPLETVQTQIKRGLAKLRVDLDERHGGDRAAWAVLIAPLAGPHLGRATGVVGTAKAVGVAVLVVGAGVAVVEASGIGRDPAGADAGAVVLQEVQGRDGRTAVAQASRPIIELASTTAQPRELLAGNSVQQELATNLALGFTVTDSNTGKGIAGARVIGYLAGDGATSGAGTLEAVVPPVLGGVVAVEGEVAGPEHHDVTDAEGFFALESELSGCFVWEVSAPGYVKAYQVRDHDLLEGRWSVALEPAGTLILHRGDAAPSGDLWVEVINEFDGSNQFAQFRAGESVLTLRSIAPGPNELRAYTPLGSSWQGPSDGPMPAQVARSHRFVLALEKPETIEIFQAAGQSLLVRVQGLGAQGVEAAVRAGNVLQGEPDGTLHSVAEKVGEGFVLKGLSPGPIAVQVLIAGEIVHQLQVAISESAGASPQVVDVELQAGSVCVEIDGAHDEHGGQLVLYGPLEAEESERQTLSRTPRPTSFEGLYPGRYEVWLVQQHSVWRELVEVGAGESSVDFDTTVTPKGALLLRFEDLHMVYCPVMVTSASGLRLMVPGLDYDYDGEDGVFDGVATEAPAELLVRVSAGSYRIDGFKSLTGHARTRASAGKVVELRRHSPPALVSTSLIARVEGRPFTGSVLSVKALDLESGESSYARPVEFSQQGRATERLRPGVYRAIDVLGRAATFEVTADGAPVVIQLR